MRIAAVLAGGLTLLAGCDALPPIGAPTEMASYNGQSYPLRVVINEPLPGVTGVRGNAVRIVAPDAMTAEAVYRANCGAEPTGMTVLDSATGEYVVPGPCG